MWCGTSTNSLTASSDTGGTTFLTGVQAPGFQAYGAESISLLQLAAGVPQTLTPTPWAGP